MKSNSTGMKTSLTPIASAVALLLFGSTFAVHAQQAATTTDQNVAAPAAPEKVEQVVVSGIRASLQQALAKKRNSDSVSEVISAEDIGKLPDKNVADAIQRLPGVNISSSASGEGGFSENDRVSIRGTSASLTQTTVNGHMIGTGDWFVLDQAGAVGRSVSYALLPSEIVSAVTVQKSQQADMLEGGVAGSVNLETRRPLDFKQQVTAEASVQAIYADLPERTDPQVNGLINWKNDANTFGIMLQAFSEDRHERRDGQEFYGYTQISPTSNAAIAHPDLANVWAPNGISSSLFEQSRKRTGGDFDIEIKPSSDLTLDLDGFSSKLNASNYNRSYYNNISANINATDPVSGASVGVIPSQYTIKNGTLVSAVIPASQYPSITTANPVTGYNSGLYTAFEDDIYRPNESSSSAYIDFSGSYRVNNSFKLKGSLGYTRGTGSTPEDIGYEAGLTGTGATYQTNGLFPASMSFPGTNTGQFTNMVTDAAWGTTVYSLDTEKYGQLDGMLSLGDGIFESAKFGIRYAEHHRDVSEPENRSCSVCNGTLSAPVPPWYGTTYPANFGSGLNPGPGFLNNVWQINPAAIEAWANQYDLTGGPNTEGWPSEFDVLEKDRAAYAMVNLAGDWWRGNVGVRFVHTNQQTLTNVPGGPNAIGQNNVNGPYTPTINQTSYDDILPSTNFKFDLNKDLVARVAVAKTMARADYSALVGAVSLNDSNDTGSSGNPNLKPVRSTNYDATLEWYFAPKSLLSAGLFYMDMSSYVTFGTADIVYYNNTFKRFDTYTISSPTNIAAQNKGVELSYQQGLWGGFGVLANFTLTDGSAADGLPVVGNSKDTYNLEAYYEDNTYSARLAYTYRSSFAGGLYNAFPQVMAGTGNLDASMSYKINDRLSLTFDALNLNNPILRYYGMNTDQPIAFYSNGRQFFLGLRMKM
jgi:iron complex outermembrane receptor protein